MAKKRASKRVTELHNATGTARKTNPDSIKRMAVIIPQHLAAKLKIEAINSGMTLQKYVADLITKHLEK